MRMRRIAVSLVALALPAVAAAQWHVTPYAGAYVPTADIAKDANVDIAAKQKTGLVLGANMNRWFSDRLGFEAGAGYVWSDVSFEPTTMTGVSLSKGAWLLPVNAKLLLRLAPPSRGTELYFGVGPSVIFSGGDAFAAGTFESDVKFERSTDLGGVASINFRHQLSNLMALKLGAESYLYSVSLKAKDPTNSANSYTFDSKFQSDFMFTGGLSFTLPGMSR